MDSASAGFIILLIVLAVGGFIYFIPTIAELVKREAAKCRFCGHEFNVPQATAAS